MRLTIDYLANHRAAIPQLAEWSYAEWRDICDQLGRSFDDVVESYEQRAQTEAIPLGVVAIDDGDVIGTGALRPQDLPLRPEMTPWLASIFVAPEYRNRGVAREIIGRLVEEARRLKLPRLYLWTSSAADLYAKLGWRELERLEYCGKTISVMLRELEPETAAR